MPTPRGFFLMNKTSKLLLTNMFTELITPNKQACCEKAQPHEEKHNGPQYVYILRPMWDVFLKIFILSEKLLKIVPDFIIEKMHAYFSRLFLEINFQRGALKKNFSHIFTRLIFKMSPFRYFFALLYCPQGYL